MDWIFKALATAGTVYLVTAAARYFGQRAAGILAALPIITAPTLAWVSHEEGVAFAISAAIGSVAASAILAIFALAYACGSRRGGIVVALACGLAGAMAIALPAALVSGRLGQALALALSCCLLAFVALPAVGKPAATGHRSRLAPVAVALVAGGLTTVAATIGPDLGSFATGLLSSLPLIGGGVAMLEHATSGPRAAAQFLRGYVHGLFGKTAFGAVFAVFAAHVGVSSALTLAGVTACLISYGWRKPPPEALSLRRWD
jgi:hypothetical protein